MGSWDVRDESLLYIIHDYSTQAAPFPFRILEKAVALAGYQCSEEESGLVCVDEEASNDGASLQSVHINQWVSRLRTVLGAVHSFPVRKSDPDLARPFVASAILWLHSSKAEVDGTGLKLKCSLRADHSPSLTVSWTGEIGWEGCREAVEQPRGGGFG